MSDKVSKAATLSFIAKAINHDPDSQLPKFPKRYFTQEASPGIRLYLRETSEPDVVEYVHEHCLANDILGWLMREVCPTFPGYEIEFKHAIEAARIWRAYARPVRHIHNILWPHEAGLTFRRLPWPKGHEQTPTFNEMFSRIANARPLKCFIGSLFDDSADMQQYIWLYGQGQNGKGALSRFLHRVFGSAYSSQIPPVNGDKFWTSMIMGKRLVVFPDCNNQSFVAGGLFKSLTGGDPVRVEQKMQPAATTVMVAKYIFLSNERPDISSEKADIRRIIFCEMQPVKAAPDPQYDDKLWAEGGSFLAECILIYQKDCEDHGIIPNVRDDFLRDWVSTVEEEFEVAFENNFDLDVNSFVVANAFFCRLQEIWPRARKAQLEFVKWMERTYGIRKKNRRDKSAVTRVYPGISLVFEGARVVTNQNSQKQLQEQMKANVGSYVGSSVGTNDIL